MSVKETYWCPVDIESGNDFLPDDTKSLPEPMSIKIDVTIQNILLLAIYKIAYMCDVYTKTKVLYTATNL